VFAGAAASMMLDRMPSRTRNHTRRASILVCGTLAVAVAAGCGGSDKPGYCQDRSDLQDSVKGLVSAASSGGVSGLQKQLTQIQSDATSLVSDAKKDFPTETSAMQSSIDGFESAVKALPSDPTPSQLTAIVAEASSVVTSVKSFYDATKSECGD
jgi:hypothetical protein